MRINVLLLLAAILAAGSQPALAGSFTLTRLTDDTWEAMSGLVDRQLVLDAAGRSHIAFMNGSALGYQTIYHAWRPDTWVVQAIAPDTLADRGPVLAAAPDGDVHVLYCTWTDAGTVVDHRRIHDGVPGTPERVCSPDVSLDYPSAAASGDGTVHVVFCRSDSLGYARCSAGTWGPAERLVEGRMGSLAVGLDGTCHVAYQLVDAQWTTTVWYVRGSAGAWSPPEHLAGGDLLDARNPTIAVDALGRAHVAYEQEGTEDYGIDYRVRDAGGWSAPQRVAPGVMPSVALDATGRPYVAYWAWWTSGGIAVSYRRDLPVWVEVSVDPEARCGFEMPLRPSLAVDAAGGIHVCYESRDGRGGDDTELWYAEAEAATNVRATPWPAGLWCAPNPALGAVVVRWTLALPSWTQVTVFDARGRHVRNLRRAPLAAGEHAATWDRLDESGRLVPAGLYVCRVSARGQEVASKVILLGR